MPNKKNIFINIALMLIFGSMVFISSCDDTITGDDLDNVDIPDQNVDYYTYIQPIFNLKCNNTNCHDDAMAGDLSFTSYTVTMRTAGLDVIFPGFPNESKLVWAVSGQSGAIAMPPPGYPPLTYDQIEGIKTWIEEGANASAD